MDLSEVVSSSWGIIPYLIRYLRADDTATATATNNDERYSGKKYC